MTATAYSTYVTVSSTGNKITVTLTAPDSTLISGTIDTNDDLSYTLSTGNLFAGIRLRDAGTENAVWTTLNAASPNATVVIRKNYP